MIDQSPRPLTLTFERLSVSKISPTVERKSAWFEKGRLGFRLKDLRCGVTAITVSDGTQAAAQGMAVGDVIEEVGGLSVRRMKERDVGGMLKSMPRPLEVVYLRRKYAKDNVDATFP